MYWQKETEISFHYITFISISNIGEDWEGEKECRVEKRKVGKEEGEGGFRGEEEVMEEEWKEIDMMDIGSQVNSCVELNPVMHV